MRRKAKEICEDLPPVELYLEDIQDIWHILSEVTTEIELETENYEITNLADLERVPDKEARKLTIWCRGPFRAHITIGPNDTTLFASNDTTAAVGLLHKIKDRLKQNKRWFVNAMLGYKPSVFLTAGFWFLVLLEETVVQHITQEKVDTMLNTLSLIMIPQFLATIWMQSIGYSKVMFYSLEHTGFWRKHRSSIIIGIVVTALGTLLYDILSDLMDLLPLARP